VSYAGDDSRQATPGYWAHGVFHLASNSATSFWKSGWSRRPSRAAYSTVAESTRTKGGNRRGRLGRL